MTFTRTLALATALSTGLAGAALAQSDVSPSAPSYEQDDSTMQPGEAMGGSMSADAPMTSGAGMVEVGGAPMFADRTIAENAPNAPNLSTLVAAVQAAGLVDTLNGPGPFTVFAPDNAAFEKLPAGTVDTLLEEANRDQLTSILTYHVVPAEATSAATMQMIQDDGGSHEVTTVQGGTLTLAMSGGNLTVTDEQGNVATVTQADVMQSNGVVHVIDTVLMPAG